MEPAFPIWTSINGFQNRARLTRPKAVATAAIAIVSRVKGVVVIGIGVIGSIVVSIVEADVRIARSASCVINSEISAAVGIAE
jgi:hypothetical protein